LDRLNPSNPNYIGPGYAQGATSPDGYVSLTIVDPQAQEEWESQQANPAPTLPTTQDIPGNVTDEPAARPTLRQIADSMPAATGFTNVNAPRVQTTGGPQVNPNLFPDDVSLDGEPGTQDGTESGPPTVDRNRIDEILGKVSSIGAELAKLGMSRDQYSEAQAQLALSTANAQKQALQLARSGNRRDRSAMEARALQSQTDLASEGARTAALLRAEEEDNLRKFRADALTKAGELGLNAGALDIDAQQLDMQAATSYLNNLFQQNNVKMELDQREAARMTDFIRDMSLIAKDYYALNQEERQSIRDDLTRRYGIDKQLESVIKQLDAQPGFWEKAGLGLIAALPGAAATMAGAPSGSMINPGSDEKLKVDVKNTPEAEFQALMDSLNSKTFEYKDPKTYGKGKNMGIIAQDLQKTPVGKSLVIPQSDGLHVDGSKAGLAALSGLALINERLKKLEQAL
jgi:hypothetical protein